MLFNYISAYVAGMREGVILEKQFYMGETLNGSSGLDIEKELKLVEERKEELLKDNAEKDAEKTAMKELGLQRSELAFSYQPTNLNYQGVKCQAFYRHFPHKYSHCSKNKTNYKC